MIENIKLREPLFVKPEVGLLEMLGIFQEGQCHLAVVTADPQLAVEHLRACSAPPAAARMLGIVTLEDVLEKVIQGDITDETDAFNTEVGAGGGMGGGLHKGVVTTQLARKIHRNNQSSDVLEELSPADKRRSLSRGRAGSRHSLSMLSLTSVNAVAGDVRHKHLPQSALSQSQARSHGNGHGQGSRRARAPRRMSSDDDEGDDLHPASDADLDFADEPLDHALLIRSVMQQQEQQQGQVQQGNGQNGKNGSSTKRGDSSLEVGATETTKLLKSAARQGYD